MFKTILNGKQNLKSKAISLTLVGLIFSFAWLLVGCMGNHSAAPVVAVAPKTAVTKGVHTVTKGESLYLIAWRYGRDINELAIANQLEEPFLIRPGDKISLRKPTLAQREMYARRNQRLAQVPKQEQPRVVVQPKAPKQVVKQPVQQQMVADKAPWIWPAYGAVVSKFAEKPKPNKGIDIAGGKGEAVKATKSGKVVYSGQGLRGYGRLLIIKHDDDYLSAYAHNDELLVKEGHYVTQGQTIAKMGQSDTNQVKLHFEIRKNGQPVDPLRYLPQKRS